MQKDHPLVFPFPAEGAPRIRDVLDRIQTLREEGGLPVDQVAHLRIAPGEHLLGEPLRLGPEDSFLRITGTPGAPAPVLHGGIRLVSWKEGRFNGRACLSCDVPWKRADLPRQFSVGGSFRPRARWPKVHRPRSENEAPNFARLDEAPGVSFQDGLFTSSHLFRLPEGAPIPEATSSAFIDTELVLLHFWVEERLPLRQWDPDTRLLETARRTLFRATDDYNHRWSTFYLDHAPGAFTEAGEWYYDRGASVLHYLPLPGEDAGNIDAVLGSETLLVEIEGRPDAPVRSVVFEGITFAHAHTTLPEVTSDPDCRELVARIQADPLPLAVSPQGAADVPAAVRIRHAEDCGWVECRFLDLGGYALRFGAGTRNLRVERCRFERLGAGGVHLSGGRFADPETDASSGHVVKENVFEDGGLIHHSGIAVFLRHASSCRVDSNRIRRFTYSAISVGWSWGFDPQASRDHLIEANDIAEIGLGWLSDLGGIYTLGLQPGTVLKKNRIARIRARGYGGGGIYLDQGSSGIRVADNDVEDCSGVVFTVNYASDNLVTGNRFAFGHEGLVTLNANRSDRAFTLERNVLQVRDDRPVFFSPFTLTLAEARFESDRNVIISTDGTKPYGQQGEWWFDKRRRVDWEEWRSYGKDLESDVRFPGQEAQSVRNDRRS